MKGVYSAKERRKVSGVLKNPGQASVRLHTEANERKFSLFCLALLLWRLLKNT